MSARLGAVNEAVIPSTLQSVGPSFGYYPPIVFTSWIMINSLYFDITTTALAGNRAMWLSFFDVNFNHLLILTNGILLPANSHVFYCIGPGLPNAAVGTTHFITLPRGFCLPPGGSIWLGDQAGIDGNDTGSGSLIYST